MAMNLTLQWLAAPNLRSESRLGWKTGNLKYWQFWDSSNEVGAIKVNAKFLSKLSSSLRSKCPTATYGWWYIKRINRKWSIEDRNCSRGIEITREDETKRLTYSFSNLYSWCQLDFLFGRGSLVVRERGWSFWWETGCSATAVVQHFLLKKFKVERWNGVELEKMNFYCHSVK